MLSKRRGALLTALIGLAIQALPSQSAKELIDDLIDLLENRLADSPLALKIISYARDLAGIPDDIGGDED